MSSDFESTGAKFEENDRRQHPDSNFNSEVRSDEENSSGMEGKCGGGCSTTSTMQGYPKGVWGFSCELAKSSRSECKACGKSISKGLMKLGVIVGEGKWGPVTCWHHVKCLILQGVYEADEVDGYEDLDEENARVLEDRIAESAGLVDENYKPIKPEELVRKEWTEPLESPSELLMPLLPYQNEGLGWLNNQENTLYRGGILADEMGMGKTIQAIGLMLVNRPPPPITTAVAADTDSQQQSLLAWSEMEVSMGRTPDLSKRGGTLVICPMVAMLQWRTELEKFVKPGTLRVILHHGSKRTTLASDLTKYDVVITTYPIVEAEYRKIALQDKVTCPDCGKHLHPEKLPFHRKYFCGETAQRTEAQAKTFTKRKRGGGPSCSASTAGDHYDDDEKGARVTAPGPSSSSTTTTTTIVSKAMSNMNKEATKAATKSHKRLKCKSIRNNNAPLHGRTTYNPPSSGFQCESSSDDDELSNLAVLDGQPLPPRSSKVHAVAQITEAAANQHAAEERDGGGGSSGSEYATATSEDTDTADDADNGGDGDWGWGGERKKEKYCTLNSSIKNEGPLVGKPSIDGLRRGQTPPITATTTLPPTTCSYRRPSPTMKQYDVIPAPLLSMKSPPSKKRKRVAAGRSKRGGKPQWREEAAKLLGGTEQSLNSRDDCDKQQPPRVPTSVLQEVSWFRIVLDESHYIKDRSSSTAKAVFRLTSLNKLCLTGTPLQNRVSELFSQVRFLRVDPYAYYLCKAKDCNCKILDYRFGPSNTCENCGHGPMKHYNAFNRYILNPIARTGYVGDGRKAFLTLKEKILDKVLLRRTKESRNHDICLPLRIVRIRVHELSEVEQDFYQALYTQGKAQFDTYVTQGVVMHNVSHLFDVLIRLRQALDHPYLIVYSSTKREGMDSVGSGIMPSPPSSSSQSAQQQQEEEGQCDSSMLLDCVVCHDLAEQPVQAKCGDVFCKDCVSELTATAPNDAVLECPSCSEPLTVDLSSSSGDNKSKNDDVMVVQQRNKLVFPKGQRRSVQNAAIRAGQFRMSSVSRKSIIHNIDLSKFQSSTKMEALMQELESMLAYDPCSKAIVFSQFVSFLDLIEYRIKIGGIDCRKLSGHMSVDARDTAIREFRADSGVKVLLISLKAGGVALNLTCASRVFLMDPWWNPAAENQAIDRIHRIGQYKPIHAVRFIVRNSIEDRIIKLQEKKKLVFDSTIGGDAGSLARLTIEDLQFLFKPGETR